MHFESWSLIAEVANQLNHCCDLSKVLHSDLDSINAWLSSLPSIVESTLNQTIPASEFILTQNLIDNDPDMYSKLLKYVGQIEASPDLVKADITEENKDLYRPILQWLGGYLYSKSPDIWYKEVVRRISSTANIDLTTVSGLRFPGDGKLLKTLDATLFKINMKSKSKINLDDPTERESDDIQADSIIYNNGSLKDLHELMNKVWADLQSDSVKPEYSAI